MLGQVVVNGLLTGLIYASFALGLTLIYSILYVSNFAHGHLGMLGAFLCLTLFSWWQGYFWLAFFLAIIAAGLLGVLVERVVFRPIVSAPHISGFLAALGLLWVLEGAATMIWGADIRTLPFPVTGSVKLGSVIIQKVRLTSGIISLALMAAVILFIYRTMLGKSLLAMGQNSTGASLIGININAMAALAFGIGTGLAAAGAVLITPVSYLFPGMAHSPLLKAFAIIIIGGMGSIPGALLGGLLLGTAESFCVQYASASWAEVVAFAVLVFTLVVRPTGIFGREV